jgi:hypothetical protein
VRMVTPGAKAPARVSGAPAAGGGDGARRLRRRWVLLLIAGWPGQVALRVWFSRMQTVPLADPDESAYLIAARVLAGGPATDFSYSTMYQGGYPLLLTPVYWFTSSPVAVYRAVLMVNAAVSATLMPLAGAVRVPVVMRVAGGLAVAAVCLVAVAQMTSHVSERLPGYRQAEALG